MKDTCYLILTDKGIDRLTKTRPRSAGRYVKVNVEMPKPPEVTVSLPQTSPEVSGTLHEQPVPVSGRVWCAVHEDVHPDEPQPVPNSDGIHDLRCTDEDWDAIQRRSRA